MVTKKRSYKQFREDNRTKTMHEISAGPILDLEKLVVRELKEVDPLENRYISRIVGERRLLGVQLVNFLIETTYSQLGNRSGEWERKEFFEEGDFIDYLLQSMLVNGKTPNLSVDGIKHAQEFYTSIKPGIKNYPAISALMKEPITSYGYFLRQMDLSKPVLLGVYGGIKSSSSANKKQALKWISDMANLITIKKGLSHKLSLGEEQKMRLENGQLYRVEDIFRMEFIYGGNTEKLGSAINFWLSYFSGHPLFEIVEQEDYLSGIKIESNGESRKRNKEYHIKVRLNQKIRNRESRKILSPYLIPDTLEIHITTAYDLLDAEFNPDFGRIKYAPKKVLDPLEKDKRYALIYNHLVRMSPSDENPLIKEWPTFWAQLGYEDYNDFTRGIREKLISGNSVFKQAYKLTKGWS